MAYRVGTAVPTATLMVGGLALSRVVDGLIAVASTVAVLNDTSSTSWVAAVALARLIPLALFGLLAVVAVQAVSQRLVLVLSALVRTGAALWLAELEYWGPSVPALIVVAVAIAGLGAAPFKAGAGRLIVMQTPETKLPKASAAYSRVDYGSVLIGPVICGALLLTLSIASTFLVTAVLATLLAASVLLVPPDHSRRASTARAMRQVISASRLVLAVRDARSFLGIRTAARVALGIVGVTLALLPARAGASNSDIAFLQAALGVGAMVIAVVPGRRPDRSGVPAVLVSAAVLVASLVLLGSSSSLVLASVALAGIGAADLALHLASSSALHRSLPSVATSVASGVADSLTAGGILVGTIVAPTLLHHVGIASTCLVALSVVVVAVFTLLPGLRRADAAFEARSRDVSPLVTVLRSSTALSGMSGVSLQAMAEVAQAVTVRRGALAIAEGAAADEVYVVRAGRLTVHVASETAARTGRMVILEPGDLFGEIGVLQSRPRTASVLATDTAQLIRIPADAFVTALTEDLGAAAAVYAGADERFRRSHD